MPTDLHDPLPRLDRGLADLRTGVDRLPAPDPADARARAGQRRRHQYAGTAGAAVLVAAAVVGAVVVARPDAAPVAPAPAASPAPPSPVGPRPEAPDGSQPSVGEADAVDPNAVEALRPYGPWSLQPWDGGTRPPLDPPTECSLETQAPGGVGWIEGTYSGADTELWALVAQYATRSAADAAYLALAESCGPGYAVRGGTITTLEPGGRFESSTTTAGAEAGGDVLAAALVDRRIVVLSLSGSSLTPRDVLDGGDAENALLGAMFEAIPLAR